MFAEIRNSAFIAPLLITIAASASLQAAELRKSPYFVDGIHCHGLDSFIDQNEIKQSYRDPEVSAIRIKSLLQNECELVFSQHGVEKFQWLTPEDLEKLVFSLKRSQRFHAVDIHIEKSVLQNHIHLIGKFTPFEAKNFYTVKASGSVERGKGQNVGNRVSSRFDGKIEFNKTGEYNRAPYVLSFVQQESTAQRALNTEGGKINGEPVTLTEEEQASLARRDGVYGAIGVRRNRANGIHSDFIELAFKSTKLSRDEATAQNISIEVGKEFQKDPLVPALTQFSLLYATYHVKSDEIYAKSDAESNQKPKPIMFGGITYDKQTLWGREKLRFYRSFTEELHYFGDLDFNRSVGQWWEINHTLGLAGTIVRGAVLPEHRFGLPDRLELQVYYQTQKKFALSGTPSMLGLKLGWASYEAENNLDHPYLREHAFGEISFNAQRDSFNVGLAFLYGSQRLY
ncbi:MAG: hypothetical protein M3Q07_11380 [Pseudobdellovibrionaceae bacterium]|nr:hypothetical protein [Pseudobdellovibrionaceae bacterium]